MLNHNFVNTFMAFIKWRNDNRKIAGQEFYSEEELKEIEKKIIRFSNSWNKVINFFVNNKLSLWWMDLKVNLFGTKYPEYLYNKNINEYLVVLSVKYQTKNWFIRQVKFLLNKERVEAEFRTTPDFKFALDTSKLGMFKRQWTKKTLNKAWSFNGDGSFEFKRVITYNKVGTTEQKNCEYGYDMNDGTGESKDE